MNRAQAAEAAAGNAANAANDASNAADEANSHADDALNRANLAEAAAGNAANAANDASNRADDAAASADEASSYASEALNQADVAQQAADDAQNTANLASEAASDAQNAANTANNASNSLDCANGLEPKFDFAFASQCYYIYNASDYQDSGYNYSNCSVTGYQYGGEEHDVDHSQQVNTFIEPIVFYDKDLGKAISRVKLYARLNQNPGATGIGNRTDRLVCINKLLEDNSSNGYDLCFSYTSPTWFEFDDVTGPDST